MNDQIRRQLQSRIESFAADVTALLQQAMADAVSGAVRSSSASRGAAAPLRASIGNDALLKEVGRKPGQRLEEIAKNLGVNSKSLKAPVARLVKAKKLKKSGQARGTRYRVA